MNAKTADKNERPDVVLDLDRLKNNCNGNLAIITELLTHLLQKSGPKWIAALREGIKADNSEALREVCHGMKGASATVFAWRISNLALELEHLARDGKVQRLSDRMVDLQAAFDELAAWINKQSELSQGSRKK